MNLPADAPWWQDDEGSRTVQLPAVAAVRDLFQLSPARQGCAPKHFTLQVEHYPDPADPPVSLDPRIHVRLRWGGPRAELTATIDSGQTVVLAGNSLRADVESFGAAGLGDTGTHLVRASVGISEVARGVAHLTQAPILALGAGATSPVFAVPPFAHSVLIMAEAVTNATIQFFRGPATLWVSHAVQAGGLLANGEAEIPGGATIANLVNNGAGAHDFTLQWRMFL